MTCRLIRLAGYVARGLSVFGMSVLLVWAAFTLLDGLFRWLFAHPLDFVRDLASIVTAAALSSCFPLIILQQANVTIRVLSLFATPAIVFTVDLLATAVVSCVLILMSLQFFKFAGTTLRAGESTPLLEIKTAPLWYWADAMLWLTSLFSLLLLAGKALDLARGRHRLAKLSASGEHCAGT